MTEQGKILKLRLQQLKQFPVLAYDYVLAGFPLSVIR